MRFPHKAYDEMIALEKSEMIQPIISEKKEEVKKEESVFDDDTEVKDEKVMDQDPEGGVEDVD